MSRTCFAVTRRVHDRRFLLRPDAALTALVTFLLAALAPLFGVEVHEFCVMSTHYHLVLSVADQRISAFFEHLNARLAKAVNVLRGARRGIVWEPGGLSIVELKTPDAIVQAIAYCIVNPVAAGLVWRPEDWPGLTVQAHELGRRVLSAARPDFFLDPRKWSEHASLRLGLPEGLVLLYGEDGARERIAAEVERQVALAHGEIRASYGKVLGPVAARNASPFQRAKSWETYGELDPHFATGRGRVAERVEAARELLEYRREYREAWLRYRAGERDHVWPYGCYVSVLRTRPRQRGRAVAAPAGSRAEGELAVGIGGELRAHVVARRRGGPVHGGELEDLVLGPAREQAQQVAQVGPRLDADHATAREERGEHGVDVPTLVAAQEDRIRSTDPSGGPDRAV